eukprot:5638822-Heterocapsa_arctica.AAC.1
MWLHANTFPGTWQALDVRAYGRSSSLKECPGNRVIILGPQTQLGKAPQANGVVELQAKASVGVCRHSWASVEGQERQSIASSRMNIG